VSRRALISLVAVGVLAFLAISLLLARYLNTESEERGAVFALLQAQARGDANGMLDRLDGCAEQPA
jgi:hypothetical protein